MHPRLYVGRRGGLALDHGRDMSNPQTSCNRHNNLVLVPDCNAGRLDEDMEWERNGEHTREGQSRVRRLQGPDSQRTVSMWLVLSS